MNSLNPFDVDGYKKPTFPHISRFDETEKFYQAEEKCHQSIFKCAKELKKLYREKNLYQDEFKEAIPEVLAQILESFDNRASELAAIAFLERQGYAIHTKD